MVKECPRAIRTHLRCTAAGFPIWIWMRYENRLLFWWPHRSERCVSVHWALPSHLTLLITPSYRKQVSSINKPWSRTDPESGSLLVKVFFPLQIHTRVKIRLKKHLAMLIEEQKYFGIPGWVNMHWVFALQIQMPSSFFYYFFLFFILGPNISC